jgi:hypothetical protein
VLFVVSVVMGLVAVGAWIVALLSALSIVGLAPAGQRMSTWFALGWWRFDKVEAATGPAALPHIRRYAMAFAALFLAILLGFVVVIAVGIVTQDNAPAEEQAAEPRRINDPRIIAVGAAGDIAPSISRASLRFNDAFDVHHNDPAAT